VFVNGLRINSLAPRTTIISVEILFIDVFHNPKNIQNMPEYNP
jgi:hypothetical protein